MQDALNVGLEAIKSLDLYFQPGFKNSNEARNLLADLLQEKAKEDRATVFEKIKAGKNYNEALSEFLSDDNFEEWVKGLEKKLYDLK